jgi:hypothetical protein
MKIKSQRKMKKKNRVVAKSLQVLKNFSSALNNMATKKLKKRKNPKKLLKKRRLKKKLNLEKMKRKRAPACLNKFRMASKVLSHQVVVTISLLMINVQLSQLL